jgi:hypothetical protein
VSGRAKSLDVHVCFFGMNAFARWPRVHRT